MSLTESVKKHALDELDMDYVGIASVDRFSGAPEGHRPADILPDARSVIVMAVRLPQGAVQAVFRSYEDDHRFLQCIYGTHGYALTPNYHLVFASYRMARFLEKKSFLTTPLPSGPGAGGAPFSHRHAAVAAGLGEFGWSGLFMTPDAGPRVRLVSVITQAELEPDPLYQGPQICERETCGICIKMCPVKAISDSKSRQAVIGGKTCEYTFTDIIKCQFSTEGLVKKSHGLKDIPMPENPTIDDLWAARDQIDRRQIKEAILPADRPSWYCGKCLAYCPLGNKNKKMEHKPVSKLK
jgi:epoxyqueuosine reductase